MISTNFFFSLKNKVNNSSLGADLDFQANDIGFDFRSLEIIDYRHSWITKIIGLFFK